MSPPKPVAARHLEIDLITRDHDFAWTFPTETDISQLDAVAATLAEAMVLPDDEREALIRRVRPLVEAPDPDDAKELPQSNEAQSTTAA